MSRIADLLRKTRQRERGRNSMPSGIEPDGNDLPQWMSDVDLPWQLEVSQQSDVVPAVGARQPPVVVPAIAPQRAAVHAVPPEVDEVVRRLFFSDEGTAIHRVLLSPVSDSVRKGNLAFQIAEGLANICRATVCLADLDLHRPTVDRHFGFQGRPGFSDIVMDPDYRFEVVHASPSIPRLSVMPAGTRTVDALPRVADPEALERLVRALSRFDYVVALTSSLGGHRDVITLGSVFDGVVLVAESATTDPGAVRAAARAIGAGDIRVLGTIIDNTPTPGNAER